MPVKGIQRVAKGIVIKLDEIDRVRTPAAVYAVLAEGGAAADTMTPVDTSNLINSRTAPMIDAKPGKVTGTLGYTASYAAAVHEASGKLKGQPRAHFGQTREGVAFGGGTEKGNYWDPNGEPQFLKKGFDSILPAVPAILKGVYGAG